MPDGRPRKDDEDRSGDRELVPFGGVDPALFVSTDRPDGPARIPMGIDASATRSFDLGWSPDARIRLRVPSSVSTTQSWTKSP